MNIRSSRQMIVCAGVGLLVVGAGEAWASPPGPLHEIEAQPLEPLLSSGEPVVECGWPMVVAVVGNEICTGTLIHPELVVYSGNCDIGDNPVVHFGEDVSSGGREVQVERCTTGPTNAAYCRLAEPVTEIPVAPPLFGCELSSWINQPAALVSFGPTDLTAAGSKHWASTTFVGGGDDWQGSTGVGICPGDLGAAVFVQAMDGSWRTAGIAVSTPDACMGGDFGPLDLIAPIVDWIETDSGVDITACHSPYWAPGPGCGGFYAQAPDVGSGSWSDWCLGTPATGDQESCNGLHPTLLPSILLDNPASGSVYHEFDSIPIHAEALSTAGGFPIRQVSVALNGEVWFISDEYESSIEVDWPVPAISPTTTYSFIAYAEDWAGNVVESEEVQITVKRSSGIDFDPYGDGPHPCAIGGDQRLSTLFGLLLLGLLRRRRS
jgi:hypothetical protein